MAGSPIATLFARLGFQVDKKGLQGFERNLQTLKSNINNMGKVQTRTADAYQKETEKSTRSTRKLKDEIASLPEAMRQAMKRGYGKVPIDLDTARRDLKNLNSIQESMEGVSRERILALRERVQNRINTLEQKQTKELERQTKRREAAIERERVARAKADRAAIKQREKDIVNRRKYEEWWKDTLNKRENAEVRHANQQERRADQIVGRYSKQEKAMRQIRREYAEVDQQFRTGNMTLEERNHIQRGLRNEYRKNLRALKPVEEHVGLLEKLERSYDRHGRQLRSIRSDYERVNTLYKSGNIDIEQRNALIREQQRQYREVLRQQRKVSQQGSRSRVGSAGGIYAGGADPRQVGNHRLISALHSDAGLGSMIAGFGAIQSSLAYQDVLGMENTLTSVTGSVEQGRKEMEYMLDIAQRLGVNVGDLTSDYAKFAASARETSISQEQQRDIFEGVAANIRVLNLSAVDSQRIFRALSQMMSTGQVMA